MSFTWIFILVGGAVFLLFFVFLIKGMTSSSEREVSYAVGQNIDTVLRNTMKSPNTYKDLQIPDMDITFECDSVLGISNYEIGKSGMTQPTDELAIFTVKDFKGPEMHAWNQEFVLGYKITDLLMLNDGRSQFVFVEDTTGYAQELYDQFPLDDDVELDQRKLKIMSATTDIASTPFERTVFITVNGEHDVGPPSDSKSENVRIDIEPFSYGLDGDGAVHFYYDDGGSWMSDGSSAYLTRPVLWAAIFSENAASFNCNMDKTMERFQFLTILAEKRREQIREAVGSDHDCYALYVTPEVSFQVYLEQIGNQVYKDMDVGVVWNEYLNLERDNDDLLRGRNCPPVY
ncbi:hypothetical protein CMO92_02960 [Candidatus Woesearchaeota archaeon]|nr:hypothetical protein [Candidatus Woesearchaeota archaeon]